MAVKTYRAKDLCEAFALIRRDFGLNATILETRQIRKRGVFGLLSGESCVEVVAADGAEGESASSARTNHAEAASMQSSSRKSVQTLDSANSSIQMPRLHSTQTPAETGAELDFASQFTRQNLPQTQVCTSLRQGTYTNSERSADCGLTEGARISENDSFRFSNSVGPENSETFTNSGGFRDSAVSGTFSETFSRENPSSAQNGTSFWDSIRDEDGFRSSIKSVAPRSIPLENRGMPLGASNASASNSSEAAPPSVFRRRNTLSQTAESSELETSRKNRFAIPSSSNESPSSTDRLSKFAFFTSAEEDDSHLLFGGGSGFFRQIERFSGENPKVPTPFRDALLQIYSKLQTADMSEHSIAELMLRLREDELLYAAAGNREPNANLSFLEKKLQEIVAQEIQTTGPISITSGMRQTVALVGPTGVGKTTTIAKLAIDYRQKRNCQVGLITLDLSRMGAVEQLQTFADVIGIPMLCASTRRQMRDAMERMANFDLVLIDTAGQSQAGEVNLQEMRLFFDAAQVNSVMLVLSSTSRTKVLTQTVKAFKSLGTTSLILTKLDESLGLGNIFPLIQSTSLPISYLTTGQKVPDDFEIAERFRLAKYILGDEQIAPRSL